MSLANASGATLSKTALLALTTAVTEADPQVTVNEDVYQRFSYGSTTRFESGTRLLFHAGQRVSRAKLDALFVTATVASVAPNTSPAAGGVDLVITGTNLGGVIGVTIGGTAATMVRSVSETKLTCRAPAHAAGTVDVVVTDDAGAVTKAGFVYTA